MRTIQILLAALLVLMPAASAAQQRPPAFITGRVVLASGSAAAGVLVHVQPGRVTTMTDSTGRYRLMIPADRFADGDSAALSAARVGLRRILRIQLVAGREQIVDLRLKEWASMADDWCVRIVDPREVRPRSDAEIQKLCDVTSSYLRARARIRSTASGARERAPAVVTGRVVIPGSARVDSVLVRIESANVGVWTDSTGRYRMLVPPSRFTDGDSVTLTITRTGFHAHDQRIQLRDGCEGSADATTKRRGMVGEGCHEVFFGTPAGRPPRSAEVDRQLCVFSAVYHDNRRRRTAPP